MVVKKGSKSTTERDLVAVNRYRFELYKVGDADDEDIVSRPMFAVAQRQEDKSQGQLLKTIRL